MRITDIRIVSIKTDTNILARVSIVIDDMVSVHGLAIMPKAGGGLFLSMPRHKHSDGSHRDTVHPINSETRKYIEKRVFDAYNNIVR